MIFPRSPLEEPIANVNGSQRQTSLDFTVHVAHSKTQHYDTNKSCAPQRAQRETKFSPMTPVPTSPSIF